MKNNEPAPIQLGRKAASLPEMHTDPVCKMIVTPESAAASYEYAGTTYYFCMPGCRDRFAADPEKYLTAESQSRGEENGEKTSRPGVSAVEHYEIEYTCPMHPEVVQIGPGSCPKCGMALEPKEISLDDKPDPEFVDMKRRFWISAVLTLPVFVLAMGEMFAPASILHAWGKYSIWVQFALATPVVLWGGLPFFVRAVQSIKNLSPNMFTLIAMGTGAAYLLSIAAIFVPGWFPVEMLDAHTGLIPGYFESAAVITTLVLLGQVLELRARSQTSSAIKELLRLAPETATVIKETGAEEVVDLRHVEAGQTLRVKANEKVPTDGEIVDGDTAIDESMVTGESMPVEKQAGDKVIGGTINGNRSFTMRAEKVGSETLLAQIVKMVGEAQRSRAPIQRLADSVSAYFVPAVIIVAVIAFIVWLVLGSFASAVVAAVSVLIIACPCALGLATPMSIVVDKTGTLTEGKPAITDIKLTGKVVRGENGDNDLTVERVLQLAGSVEKHSEHPLAHSIVTAAEGRGLKTLEVKDFESETGIGVSGIVDGRKVFVGRSSVSAISSLPAGRSNLEVRIDGLPAASIHVSDPIKPSAERAVKALKNAGIKIVMMTGDAKSTAEAVARELGISEIFAEVMPEDKAAKVKSLQADNRRVAMAGDGVNDAPALAQADVGIAFASGTDVAIESANITLLKPDLDGILKARNLSRATMKNIRQNLFFAFIYNIVGVPIAAGVLFPVFGLLLSPMIASAAMTFSSVSVILNALRLRNRKI